MTCANPDYVRSGRIATYDLTSVVAYMSEQPYVDRSRVLGIGQSTGGFAWLATAAKAPPGLRAVINFAGGHGSLRPYENCSESQMLLAMREFGGTARVPSLWIYAANDTFVVPDFAKRMHAAFVGAGGSAEFAPVPPFENDGHPLVYRGAGSFVWTPLVDDFLRRQGLPTWSLETTGIDAVPAARRADFQRYLAASGEKAFVLSDDGARHSFYYARVSAADAVEQALARCQEGGLKCRPFAINFAAVSAGR
jgi:dienelactone hydrolase